MRGGAEVNPIPAVVLNTIREMEAGATSIVLRGNRIGDEGARALADGLRETETVTVMWLSLIGIGDGGARALADGLRENATVTSVNLNDNQIGDRGCAARWRRRCGGTRR